MRIVDTHTHLYLKEFNSDRDKVIEKAIERGVKIMLMPNIDSSSVEEMLAISEKYPGNCFPMMGLHPTSVKENYKEELEIVSAWLEKRNFVAIGEIGIDLYWDKSYKQQQEKAFIRQIEMARKHDLPIVIHQRNSFKEILHVLKSIDITGITGVFHCFTGIPEQAQKIIDLGFLLGIGGVLTFKNSKLSKTLEKVDLKHIILETDSPFLTPHPYRGQRNESAYTYLVAKKLADVKNKSVEEIAEITTGNAKKLFNLPV